jgi:hypothetical protein
MINLPSQSSSSSIIPTHQFVSRHTQTARQRVSRATVPAAKQSAVDASVGTVTITATSAKDLNSIITDFYSHFAFLSDTANYINFLQSSDVHDIDILHNSLQTLQQYLVIVAPILRQSLSAVDACISTTTAASTTDTTTVTTTTTTATTTTNTTDSITAATTVTTTTAAATDTTATAAATTTSTMDLPTKPPPHHVQEPEMVVIPSAKLQMILLKLEELQALQSRVETLEHTLNEMQSLSSQVQNLNETLPRLDKVDQAVSRLQSFLFGL